MTIFTPPIIKKVQPEAQARVKWNDVILFSLLAYGLTWAWQAVKLAPHLGDLLTASKTPADSTAVFGSQLYPLVGLFGPMLAAIFMRLFISREGCVVP